MSPDRQAHVEADERRQLSPIAGGHRSHAAGDSSVDDAIGSDRALDASVVKTVQSCHSDSDREIMNPAAVAPTDADPPPSLRGAVRKWHEQRPWRGADVTPTRGANCVLFWETLRDRPPQIHRLDAETDVG